MMKQFLIRPPAYQGEWYWSWVGRTALANGLQAIKPSTLASCSYFLETTGPAQKADQRFPRDLKFCPGCMETEPYLRAHWQFSENDVCPAHACVLQHQCYSCKVSCGLHEVLRMACICGHRISSQNLSRVTPREVALSKAFEWDNSEPERSRLRSFAWKLLLQVARARRGRDITFRGRRAGDHAAEWLEVHGLPFDVSIKGITTFLASLHSPIHQAAASTWLKQLTEDQDKSMQDLQGLPLRDWLNTLSALGAPMKRDRMVGSKSRPPEMLGYYSLSAAARRFGIATTLARRWITDGSLKAISVPSVNHPFLMVREEDVAQRLQIYRNDSVRSRPLRATNLRGIGRCARRQLRVCGLVDPTGSPRALDEMPLGEVLRALSEKAEPKITADFSLVELTDPQWWRLKNARALGLWLREAMNGNRPIFRDEHVNGFEGIYAPADQLLILRRLSASINLRKCSPDQTELFENHAFTGLFSEVPSNA